MRRSMLLLLPLLLAASAPRAPKLKGIALDAAGCDRATTTTCRLVGQWSFTGNWSPTTDSLKVTWKRTLPTAATLATKYTRSTADTVNVTQPAAGQSMTVTLTVVTFRAGSKDSAVATATTTVDGPPPPPDAVAGLKIIPAFQTLTQGGRAVYCGVAVYQSGALRLIPGSDTIPVCRATLAAQS